MRILVLSTWFPYPLSQGSKIRAYHLIKGLAAKHDVALLSFQDAPVQPAWVEHMMQWCRRVEVVPRDPFASRRVSAWSGWLSLRPSAVVASYSADMAQRVQQLAGDWMPDRILALTFVTAPYALMVPGVPRLVDVDNLMTPMLRESGRRATGALPRLRAWLACEKFRRYERGLYPRFDGCLVVSDRDRPALQALTGIPDARIGVVPNGVDAASHAAVRAVPQPGSLVFNGALTYTANYDAMDYFLREIFPSVRAAVPEARLVITGSTRGVPIDQLPAGDQVTFTGYLDDVRPAVAASSACVAPLRIGGGTRLKILEAMALGTPVVSTPKGAEGLEVEAGRHLLIAGTPQAFAAHTARLLREPAVRQSLAAAAAGLVAQKYDWAAIGRSLCDRVEQA